MVGVHEPREQHQDTRAERILVVVGIVVLAFNLRPAAVSVGPVLAELTADLGMSSTAAGLLTTLPVLAFATFGMAAPGMASRVGVHRLTLWVCGPGRTRPSRSSRSRWSRWPGWPPPTCCSPRWSSCTSPAGSGC